MRKLEGKGLDVAKDNTIFTRWETYLKMYERVAASKPDVMAFINKSIVPPSKQQVADDEENELRDAILAEKSIRNETRARFLVCNGADPHTPPEFDGHEWTYDIGEAPSDYTVWWRSLRSQPAYNSPEVNYFEQDGYSPKRRNGFARRPGWVRKRSQGFDTWERTKRGPAKWVESLGLGAPKQDSEKVSVLDPLVAEDPMDCMLSTYRAHQSDIDDLTRIAIRSAINSAKFCPPTPFTDGVRAKDEQYLFANVPLKDVMSVAPTILDKRLYIGNIDASVAEYHLVKLFQPFGKITRIDYMWHKFGPNRGQPKGFCFLEYETHESAMNAIKSMDGKQIKNKHLVVSFSFDPKPEESSDSIDGTASHRGGGAMRTGPRPYDGRGGSHVYGGYGHGGHGDKDKDQGELIVQPKLMTGR
ncbi:putative RNA-binding protein 18 [Gonapodya sp. JEL0774]|nr:putative RNA-binding protein 18 [Gonapodya sp. JEL0774]